MIKEGARAVEYEFAIRWLIDAGIVHKVSRISEPKIPLKFYEDSSAFKFYILDCGLFSCISDAPAAEVLIGNNIFAEYKGVFTEQFVLQQFVCQNITPYYWSNAKTPAEIDFVIQIENRVVPIEVKAEGNVQSRSLRQLSATILN